MQDQGGGDNKLVLTGTVTGTSDADITFAKATITALAAPTVTATTVIAPGITATTITGTAGTLGVVGALGVTGILAVTPAERPATDYAYLAQITGDLHTGGAAQKTYALGITTTRPVTSAATGDSNDALIKGSFSNYAANDANFVMRGMNCTINNRDGGNLGTLDNQFGCQNKSGATVATLTGLTVVPENYGTVSDVFGGIDVVMKNEAIIATLEFGIRVRNINDSVAGTVNSAILVSDTGANTGFTNGLDMNGATITNEIVFSNGTKLTVSGDTIVFTNAAGSASETITMT